MADNVQLSVKSQLNKIIQEMEAIKKKAEEVSESFGDMGDQVGENLKDNTKKTETFLGNLRNVGRRVADQLKGDFKSLFAVNALTDSMKISNQFKGSVAETVKLSDSIRKLGVTFGLTSKEFASFQTKLTKGLGEVGLSSDVATRSLEGLAGTPVRGQSQVMGYAKTSGMLASLSGSQGREGDIAKGMAKVIQARGGNVNDVKQMEALAGSLRKVFNETGMNPADTLRSMEQVFAQMPKDLRESISSDGLMNLASANAIGGPNATKFLEEYLSKGPIARMAFDAQGGKDIFTNEGLNSDKFKKFADSIMGRVGGDPRMAAQTLGLSEDAAEGFIRLAENLNKVTEAQDRIAKSTGSITEQYRKSMGLSEAFSANINKVKGSLAGVGSFITQKGSNLLGSASESTAGSAGVVAGGGILAALLAGGGLRGIGKGLGGTLGKGALASAVTGEKVQPVYVVNASEIGGGGMGALGKLGKGAGMAALLGKAGLIGGAAAVGVGLGYVAEKGVNKYTQGTSSEGFEGSIVERLFFKLDKLFGGEASSNFMKNQKVVVELNRRDLRESKQPTRGSSF